MRKIVSIVMLLWLSVTMYAQEDVTKFLGIPVDGSKSEMIQKLIEKGYKRSSYDEEVLEGEFNGTEVYIHVVTNNNKVYRIAVYDVNGQNETDISIRFNNLCRQFQNNRKYISTSSSPYTLEEDEDISYGMTVRKKRYEAAYYQIPEIADSLGLSREDVQASFLQYFSKEPLTNEKDSSNMDKSSIKTDSLTIEETITKLNKSILALHGFDKSVWFMIVKISERYHIAMYYDNRYNQAHGEDL